MNTKEISVKVRCDMPNCRKTACIKFEKEGFFRSAGLYLCEECMKDLYKQIGQRMTPKSPSNMLNKKNKSNKEEI